jgi:hypothetical protein
MAILILMLTLDAGFRRVPDLIFLRGSNYHETYECSCIIAEKFRLNFIYVYKFYFSFVIFISSLHPLHRFDPRLIIVPFAVSMIKIIHLFFICSNFLSQLSKMTYSQPKDVEHTMWFLLCSFFPHFVNLYRDDSVVRMCVWLYRDTI